MLLPLRSFEAGIASDYLRVFGCCMVLEKTQSNVSSRPWTESRELTSTFSPSASQTAITARLAGSGPPYLIQEAAMVSLLRTQPFISLTFSFRVTGRKAAGSGCARSVTTRLSKSEGTATEEELASIRPRLFTYHNHMDIGPVLSSSETFPELDALTLKKRCWRPYSQ